MASRIRLLRSGIRQSKSRGIIPVSSKNSTMFYRKFSSNSPNSHNRSPIYLVDTLALVIISLSLSCIVLFLKAFMCLGFCWECREVKLTFKEDRYSIINCFHCLLYFYFNIISIWCELMSSILPLLLYTEIALARIYFCANVCVKVLSLSLAVIVTLISLYWCSLLCICVYYIIMEWIIIPCISISYILVLAKSTYFADIFLLMICIWFSRSLSLSLSLKLCPD